MKQFILMGLGVLPGLMLYLIGRSLPSDAGPRGFEVSAWRSAPAGRGDDLSVLVSRSGAHRRICALKDVFPRLIFNHPVGRDAARSELKRAFCSSLSKL